MKEIKFSNDRMEIDLLDKNELMRLKMWIVRAGDNAHSLPITEDALDKGKDSLVGKPVVAKYSKYLRDLMGHELDEVPVGCILSKEDIFFEQDENGVRWLCAYATIWTRYASDVAFVMNRDKIKNISMEILTNINDNDEIVELYFTGVTLIGVEPAIPNARAEVIEFSKLSSKINELYFSAKNDYLQKAKQGYKEINKKDFSDETPSPSNDEVVLNKHTIITNTENFEKGEESLKDKKMEKDIEAKEEDKKVDMSANENVDPNAQAENLEKDAESNKEKSEEFKENKFEDESKESDESEAKEEEDEKSDDSEEEDTEDFAKMKTDYEKLKEEHTVLMSEVESLRKFKCDYEEGQKMAKVEETLFAVSDIMPKDKIEEFRKESVNYSLDNIQILINTIKANALDFAKPTKNDGITRIGIPQTQEVKTKKGLWD